MRGPAARPIVIAAGGTGGHFFPAEALAMALITRGHRIVLMTDTRTGARLGPVFSGVEHYVLRGAGVAGRGMSRGALAALSLAAGTFDAWPILSRLGASCLVGFGGYPSVPPVLAARLLRRRPAIVLHEQNAVLGRATRFCLRAADLLALGFANTDRVPTGTRSVFTGNPVRPPIANLSGRPYTSPVDRIQLLVLGGSLGARIFGTIIPKTIRDLSEPLRARLHIVQQCRAEDMGDVTAAYRSMGISAEVAPFFTDVADRLATAHLVISRAGASICAELAAVGRPAILVPLPGAIDDHQMANARAMPGATVIAQGDMTPASFAALLTDFLCDPAKLRSSAERIAVAGRADAADALADALEPLIARLDVVR